MNKFCISAYIYKKTVDWSLLTEGLTLPLANQVVFGQTMGRFLRRGESKPIRLLLGDVTYNAKVTSVNFDPKFNRKDILQIRYTQNGDLARALQACFPNSYNYLAQARLRRTPGDRTQLKLPEEAREYLVLYTTEYDDTYIMEPITVSDFAAAKAAFAGQSERAIEIDFNSGIETGMKDERVLKLRRLNRSIAENLKLLYENRCQICGRVIGREYGVCAAEAHHIVYFTQTFNNDPENQLLLCPEHHAIIHETDPRWEPKHQTFIYPNGFTEKLMFNKHIPV